MPDIRPDAGLIGSARGRPARDLFNGPDGRVSPERSPARSWHGVDQQVGDLDMGDTTSVDVFRPARRLTCAATPHSAR